jgi:hypothetical protein
VADEKHSWWWGDRIYIVVTAAMACFLGVGVTLDASGESLTTGYGEFAAEVADKAPDYQPTSVNLDGWAGSHQAWQTLFPGVLILRCFLHVVLGMRDCCRSHPDLWPDLQDALWHLYHSLNPRQFGQRLRRLLEWTDQDDRVGPRLQAKLDALQGLAGNFKHTFDDPDAYRTSNQVDRLINYQDRILYVMQYFHGSLTSARQALRAMAMLWNFHPYAQRTQNCRSQKQQKLSRSPFEDLNGFRYHDNWLKNLLIASSLNGRHTGKPVSHKSMEN